jgi:hypothetical protein
VQARAIKLNGEVVTDAEAIFVNPNDKIEIGKQLVVIVT